MNLSLKVKLFGMTSIMMFLMAMVGIIGLTGFRQSNEELEKVFQVNMKNAAILSKIDGMMRAIRIQMLLALQHDPSNEFSKLHDHETSVHIDMARQYNAETEKLWNDYYGRLTDATSRTLADTYHKDRMAYLKEGIEPVIAAVQNNDFREAYRITMEIINPTIQKANRSLEALMKHDVDLAEVPMSKAKKATPCSAMSLSAPYCWPWYADSGPVL